MEKFQITKKWFEPEFFVCRIVLHLNKNVYRTSVSANKYFSAFSNVTRFLVYSYENLMSKFKINLKNVLRIRNWTSYEHE
jgi:hypothetical protein